MQYNDLAKDLSLEMINYANDGEYSLMQVFNLLLEERLEETLDENMVLMNTITWISEFGYDIISTHPLRFQRYKWLDFYDIAQFFDYFFLNSGDVWLRDI